MLSIIGGGPARRKRRAVFAHSPFIVLNNNAQLRYRYQELAGHGDDNRLSTITAMQWRTTPTARTTLTNVDYEAIQVQDDRRELRTSL
jgi:hypothetical protein